MIIVIIAGGSGTRLWPLSTPDYPKHLLSVDGNKSLLQDTYERAKKLGDKIYVATDASHAHHVCDQLVSLGKQYCITEPARRGTANCIVAALERVAKYEDKDEPIAILSADHFIRDEKGFLHSFKVAGEASKAEKRIVLVGVEPDYPAIGFGYIQKGDVFDEQQFVFKVHSFKEKPAHDLAQEYVNSGQYLWNCGYFVGSVNTFLASMREYAPELHASFGRLSAAKNEEEYEKIYLGLKTDTIDYALMEKADNLLVVPASFDWLDLGSYADLHKAVASDEKGNHIQGKKVQIDGVDNSFIRNQEDKPVVVIGLDNVVVINTPNGVLVARKDMAQKVGEISKRFTQQ